MSRYSEVLLQHFYDPYGVGVLSIEPGVLCFESGFVEQGSWVRWTVRLDEAGKVLESRYQVYGAPEVVSICSHLCAWLEGRQFEDVFDIQVDELSNYFKIDEKRRHSVAFAVQSLQKGLNLQ